MQHLIFMTIRFRLNDKKNYLNNTKILDKQNKKISQIIFMEAKLKNFKGKPNKT